MSSPNKRQENDASYSNGDLKVHPVPEKVSVNSIQHLPQRKEVLHKNAGKNTFCDTDWFET